MCHHYTDRKDHSGVVFTDYLQNIPNRFLQGFIDLRYLYPDDRFLNHVISVISVVVRETTLTVLESNTETVSMGSETMRVVPLSITEIK